MAHRIDLGSRLCRAFGKEVAVGDSVRAVGLRMNSNDLAAQVIRVSGRFLRVPGHPARALVDRRVARGERIGVVPGGQVEIARAVEGDRASRVTALEPLGGDLEQHFLRCEVERVSLHREARQHVLRVWARRRVVHVEPAVRRKVGIGGESEQSVFRLARVRVLGADGNRRDAADSGLRRLVEVDVAVAFDEQHALVGQDGELDGFIQLLGEHDSGEAILFRPRAIEVDRPGSHRVAQSAEQVLQEERLGVGRFRVPHVGVPRPPAGEIVVPAHGVVCAVRPSLVTRFVDLDEHMDRRIDRLEVVELVFALEAERHAFRRHVRRVERAVAALANVGIVGMAVEVRARQPAVPRPVVLRICGGVHADISAARLDVALEVVLLRRIQDVTRRTQEDDRAVSRQVLMGEGAGILGRVDRESVLLPKLPECGDAVGDGVVAISCRFGEDEHPRFLRVYGDGDRDRGKERERNEESVHGNPRAGLTMASGVSQSVAQLAEWIEARVQPSYRVAEERES